MRDVSQARRQCACVKSARAKPGELRVQSTWNPSLCLRPEEANGLKEWPDLDVVEAFGLPILQGMLRLAFPVQ